MVEVHRTVMKLLAAHRTRFLLSLANQAFYFLTSANSFLDVVQTILGVVLLGVVALALFANHCTSIRLASIHRKLNREFFLFAGRTPFLHW